MKYSLGILWRTLIALAFLASGDIDASPARKTGTTPSEQYQEQVRDELAVVAKTRGLLDDKLALRHAEMKSRVRAIYKLSRAGWSRLWLEPGARGKVARWLGAARRINARDMRELGLLREELEVADAAELRLKGAERRVPQKGPASRSLVWPVAGSAIVGSYGGFEGPSRRVRLWRRGVEISAEPGAAVRAPAAGVVRYAGPIAGLGQGLIVQHQGYTTIIGRLKALGVDRGDSMAAGDVVAEAAVSQVYLELRLSVGALGQPVDPTRLLARSSR